MYRSRPFWTEPCGRPDFPKPAGRPDYPKPAGRPEYLKPAGRPDNPKPAGRPNWLAGWNQNSERDKGAMHHSLRLVPGTPASGSHRGYELCCCSDRAILGSNLRNLVLCCLDQPSDLATQARSNWANRKLFILGARSDISRQNGNWSN